MKVTNFKSKVKGRVKGGCTIQANNTQKRTYRTEPRGLKKQRRPRDPAKKLEKTENLDLVLREETNSVIVTRVKSVMSDTWDWTLKEDPRQPPRQVGPGKLRSSLRWSEPLCRVNCSFPVFHVPSLWLYTVCWVPCVPTGIRRNISR